MTMEYFPDVPSGLFGNEFEHFTQVWLNLHWVTTSNERFQVAYRQGVQRDRIIKRKIPRKVANLNRYCFNWPSLLLWVLLGIPKLAYP